MTLKEKLNEIIFGYSTPAGRAFDLCLILAIVFSVLAVMLDSVAGIHQHWRVELAAAEWFFTGLFTLEYLTRLYCCSNRWRYLFSFYGLVDLLSITPTYLALLIPGANTLLIVRILRVLRVFRILKLMEYSTASQRLVQALVQSGPKIFVFFASLLGTVTVFGALMYLIEGPENGFTSIPRSMYWAIVTMTTVGYGDISPHTPLGQALASIVMLLGYSVIAVPTGILTNELARQRYSKTCHQCGRGGHEPDSHFCRHCGARM
ncbi:ion transporter [Gallaecimonas pentaromativorans]|uniref:Voltage-gated potassium channel n=1 Tax=Gallaecimonas pentaromativorans TaxID=584787 RepID=A0A3N1PSW1_9GAMM|nr:ion transporter [Gallaecimonas pentaromativorans]MED5524108.1 ion transporter [Pseudomonadota bacterium]ROQ29867.1 voltage-gated potassium channel [Gallaecimonas pentaromativorans]